MIPTIKLIQDCNNFEYMKLRSRKEISDSVVLNILKSNLPGKLDVEQKELNYQKIMNTCDQMDNGRERSKKPQFKEHKKSKK